SGAGGASAWVIADLARCERNAGRLEAAEEVIAAALEQFPGSARILSEAAMIAMKRGRWDEAAERWTALMRIDAKPTERGFAQWATALLRQGRLDEARAAVEQGLARYP